MAESSGATDKIPIPLERAEYMQHVKTPRLEEYLVTISRTATTRNEMQTQLVHMQQTTPANIEEKLAESKLEGQVSGMKAVLDKISPPASADVDAVPSDFSNNMAVIAQHLETLKHNLLIHEIDESALVEGMGEVGQLTEKALLEGKVNGIEEILGKFGQKQLLDAVNQKALLYHPAPALIAPATTSSEAAAEK